MVALAIVLLLGSAVRAAYAFPTHRNPIDADALLSGMAALRILDGDLLVFFAGGTRLGALECYLHAAFFRLAGASRESLAIAPLLSGCAFLVFFWLFVREILSQRTALLALAFAALPAPAFLFWTYVPTGYANTLLFATVTLWLAARIARAGPTRLSALGLGLCAGLGLWNSLQTLGALIPAAAWLLLHRTRLYKDWHFAVPAAAGFLAGGSPWIVFNLVYPLGSLRDNFAAAPASGLAQILENAKYFLSYDLVELTVGRDPAVRRSLTEWLHTEIPRHALSLIYLLALTAALIQLAGATHRDRRPRWSPVLLLSLIAVCVAALKVFSGAGAVRGATVRYALLLSVVFPPMLASFAAWISRRSRLIAAIMVLGVLLFNAGEYLWPWTKIRKQWRREAAHMDRLTAFLLQEKIAWAIGDYWIVYPLNFLTEGRVKGIPYQEGADYYRYLDEVKGRPHRIALVAGRVEAVKAWMSRADLHGRALQIAPELAVAIPLVKPATYRGPEEFRRSIGPPPPVVPPFPREGASRNRGPPIQPPLAGAASGVTSSLAHHGAGESPAIAGRHARPPCGKGGLHRPAGGALLLEQELPVGGHRPASTGAGSVGAWTLHLRPGMKRDLCRGVSRRVPPHGAARAVHWSLRRSRIPLPPLTAERIRLARAPVTIAR